MIARRALLASASLLCAPRAGAEPTTTAPRGTLVFADEFDRLDWSKWQTAFPWGKRSLGNGDLQVYVDPAFSGNTGRPLGLNPFSINNGVLAIEATKVSADVADQIGANYASGMLCNHKSFSQTYGYFAMRARMPAGAGEDACRRRRVAGVLAGS
jgi:beta-glucanase (GH16 family)